VQCIYTINGRKTRCKYFNEARINCFNFATKFLKFFVDVAIFVVAEGGSPSRQVLNLRSSAMYVTISKQAENEAFNHVLGKCILSRCCESRMETEIGLRLGRCTIWNDRNATGDQSHPTNESFMQKIGRICGEPNKIKLSKR